MSVVAAHFKLDIDAVGNGPILVNGDDVTHLTAGTDLTVRRGQPTILTLHMLGDATIEGEGIVHVVHEHSAADAQAEVLELLDSLDPDELWAIAMADPDDTGGPSGMLLRAIRRLITGDAP